MTNLPENVSRITPAKARSSAKKPPLVTLHEKFGPIANLVTRRNGERVLTALREMVEIRGCSPEDRPRALLRLDRLPPLAELDEQRHALRVAIYDPATEAEIRSVMGLMLEQIPAAATGATPAYGDGLTFELMHADDERDPDRVPRFRGFSAAVLFATSRRIVQTATFTPTTAEVLRTAQTVRSEYFAALGATNRLIALVENAQGVVEDTEPLETTEGQSGDEIPF
ncbi:hypothetical protein AMST5_03598 [freshwater sediment metagenome]|uniref:Uncharacterized protein n=1 Tax=freshwater sediment metagenome TaxID=556182 RepID=A0AA48M453_9ZZZZ